MKRPWLRRIGRWALMLVCALVLAVGVTWWSLSRIPALYATANGPWVTTETAGSTRADLYTRAAIALTALFALDRSETIYFSAVTDSAGEKLRRACTYVIEGKAPEAGWWSITAYADDHFLIPNVARRYSFNMGNARVRPDGVFRIVASPAAHADPWLPTGEGSGGFSLLLRLYNPSAAAAAAVGTVPLPAIRREGPCP